MSKLIVFLVKVACSARNRYVKDANTQGTSTKGDGTESICIRKVYIRNICSDSRYIGINTCFNSFCRKATYIGDTKSVSIRDAYIRVIFILMICIKSAYTRSNSVSSFSAIKCLEIYS